MAASLTRPQLKLDPALCKPVLLCKLLNRNRLQVLHPGAIFNSEAVTQVVGGCSLSMQTNRAGVGATSPLAAFRNHRSINAGTKASGFHPVTFAFVKDGPRPKVGRLSTLTHYVAGLSGFYGVVTTPVQAASSGARNQP